MENNTLEIEMDDAFYKSKAISRLERIAKLLRHPIKRQIYTYLCKGEMTVTELYCKVRMEQSTCSMFLNEMRKLRLVRFVRDGKNIHYRVNTETRSLIYHIINLM